MIEVSGLEKRFGATPVLRGVDLAVAPGRVTALVGPNGSGKTTSIKSILGLVRADAGLIRFDGQIVNGDCAYRDRIGYMPQLPRFPENLTGREVITLLERMRPGAARDRGLVDAFALGPQLDKPLRDLSGGTRQRINATVAFLFDPTLLIMDEPTAGLDPTASTILKDYIRAARDRGRTFIVSSHVMAELQTLADDVAFLLDGRIGYKGSLDALRARTGEETLERAVARLMREGEVR
jgi:Cu-processing system ATP-binding protein